MDERIVQTKINKLATGKTLINFLAERFSYHSKNEWRNLIKSDFIKVNGINAEPETILNFEDLVSFDTSSFKEPEVNAKFATIYEDDNFLIVDKAANLPVHPAGPFFKNTLWWILKNKYEKIHILTRLDRESSGLVIIAKNPKAVANFAKLKSNGEVKKTYIAIVFGCFPDGRFIASGSLITKENSIVRKKLYFDGVLKKLNDSDDEPQKFYKDFPSNWAITIFRKINCDAGISALEAELISGRTHQIRATLSSLNFPLLGDKIYGVNENAYIKFVNGTIDDCDFRKLGAKRQLLHCREVVFPIGGNEKNFLSDIPEDMKSYLSFCK